MAPRHRQSGFTMLELLIAGSLLVVITGAALRLVATRANRGYFEQALSEAYVCANRADDIQREVDSSAVDSTGVYQYTWRGTDANWYRLDTLNTEGGTPLPLTSPYKTAYEWNANGSTPGRCRFIVPAGYAHDLVRTGVVQTPSGTGTLVTVTALRYPNKNQYTFPTDMRHQLYLEVVR